MKSIVGWQLNTDLGLRMASHSRALLLAAQTLLNPTSLPSGYLCFIFIASRLAHICQCRTLVPLSLPLRPAVCCFVCIGWRVRNVAVLFAVLACMRRILFRFAFFFYLMPFSFSFSYILPALLVPFSTRDQWEGTKRRFGFRMNAIPMKRGGLNLWGALGIKTWGFPSKGWRVLEPRLRDLGKKSIEPENLVALT